MKIAHKNLTLALLVSVSVLLSGCGQSGPLVLPEKAPSNDKREN